MKKPPQGKTTLQVGALPLRRTVSGSWEILLVTTRTTKRWTVPKGWPIKKLKAHEAAAREAGEEAGVVGQVKKKPVGRYLYWKRMEAEFALCKVRVYPLRVTEHWTIGRSKPSASVIGSAWRTRLTWLKSLGFVTF